MKTFLIFLVLMIFASLAFSQSLITSNRQWHNLQVGSFPLTIHTEVIEFTSDTVIEGLTYKIARKSLDDGYTWQTTGYIREDNEKMVYFRFTPESPEKLMYDFNAETGDTLLVSTIYSYSGTYGIQESSFVVVSTDSILIGARYRKQINLGNEELFVTEHWIDSTGNLGGILHNNFGFVGGDAYSLYCYFENEENLYSSETAICEFITGTTEPKVEQNIIMIYPNPAAENIFFDFGSAEKQKQVVIYDQIGRIKANFTTKYSTMELSLKDYDNGLYFITVFCQERLYISKEFIVRK